MYEGKFWPTTEHVYQASKFDDEKIKDEIFNAKSHWMHSISAETQKIF